MPKQDVTTLRDVASVLKDGLESLHSHNQAIEKSIKSFEAAVGILENSQEETVVKRGPGRPPKHETKPKRGPGRPPKSETTKRGPGRPKKSVSQTTTSTTQKKSSGSRGRPSIEEILSEPLTSEFEMEINRIEEEINNFNEWYDESTNDRAVWKIDNGSYLGVIEGFYSSGNSGRYGITTRIFINPDSHLVPENLKGHINTAAVNRIRYVENEEDGLDYIEKQKSKIEEQFFNEPMPRILKDHGKKGSAYAFHLDSDIRRDMNKMKILFDHKVYPKLKEQSLV